LHDGKVKIEYDTGEIVVVQLRGTAENIFVKLENSFLQHGATYITLESQKRVKLYNKSDVKISFEWKAFSSEAEDDQYRRKNLLILEHEEQEAMETLVCEHFFQCDMMSFFASVLICILTLIAVCCFLNQEKDVGGSLSLDSKEVAAATKKFKSKKREVVFDQLLFRDDVFSIEPLSGELYPRAEMEFIVTFAPTSAASYHRVAFLCVTGRETRLPLEIEGEGVGPNLSFTYDSLDLGDVFINSEHHYEVCWGLWFISISNWHVQPAFFSLNLIGFMCLSHTFIHILSFLLRTVFVGEQRWHRCKISIGTSTDSFWVEVCFLSKLRDSCCG
jgi:hydrocephalus-inducing protein